MSAICDMSRKASKTASGKAVDADLLLNVCFVLVDWLLISAALVYVWYVQCFSFCCFGWAYFCLGCCDSFMPFDVCRGEV